MSGGSGSFRDTTRGWSARGLAAAILLVALASPGAAASGDAAVVRTDAGRVRGAVTDAFRLFQGIPFAAPPVGRLRFAPPAPVPRWSGVRDARAPGGRCPQLAAITGEPASQAEDCLYLNVTTPGSASPHARKPVLVWVHGGGLANGSGSDFDARRLAVGGDLVVVTVNYRLGALGFLGLRALPGSGTLGLQDQQAALRWVRRNIAAFGGDPARVTLAGESAGAHSSCAQLASPAAAGLFDRVILQSNPCVRPGLDQSPSRPLVDLPVWLAPDAADDNAMGLARQAGCADGDTPPAAVARCLRGLPVTALLGIDGFLVLPSYGNQVLPENPDQVLLSGRFHRVPVLAGITRDEGTFFAALLTFAPIPADQYRPLLDTVFGDDAARVEERYPLSAYRSARHALAAIVSDREWAWPAQEADDLFARHVPTWSYVFTDRRAAPLFDYPPDIPAGASHGAELGYLFDRLGRPNDLDPAQRALADRMIGYWARFARASDPNGAGLPRWPRYRHHDAVPRVQELGPARVGPYDRTGHHQLEFWRDLG
jgi:para-nitrobenzyl esterase